MSQPKVPYAAYPKYGPEVLGKAEYDRQIQAWEAYQASLRQEQPKGDDEHRGTQEGAHEGKGHYDDEEGSENPPGGDHDDSNEGEDMYTYVRKYTLPGQSRRRVFRRQGITAQTKSEARKIGRESMTESLGQQGQDWEAISGTEKVVKPRGKPFEEGQDERRNEEGKNGSEGSEGSGGDDGDSQGQGQGQGQGKGKGGGDDDTPKPPTCPKCGERRGTTEGCCKPKDPGQIPPPKAGEEQEHDLQLLRTNGAPYMNGEAEARLRAGARPEVVEVLTKSLAEVDTWTREVVRNDVERLSREVFDALGRSHKALAVRIAEVAMQSGNGNGDGSKSRDGLTKGQVRAIIEDMLKHAKVDTEALAEKVAAKLNAPRRIVVESNGKTHEVKGIPHKQFEPALKAVNRGLWPFLVGPAGSGKGYLAQHLAEALGRRYGFVSCSEGMSEGMLLGRGVPLADKFLYLQSSFVDFYENGGVFLLDEIDAANPNVLLIINECLSSPHLSIPNRTEKPYAERHPDFVAIVAANTWGTGPNMEYVGRNRLDAAFLNRFVGSQFEIDYDAKVESEIAKSYLGAKEAEDVLRRFWGIRKKLNELQIRRVWSTRGLQKMCVALADGDSMAEVLDSHTRGWTQDERNKAGV